MAKVLIVGETSVTSLWGASLAQAGHHVETAEGSLAFQDRFTDEPYDVIIIDIANADRGEALLISQVRSAWPDCRVIASAPNYAFRSSAVFDMGLWSPDQFLIKPVNPRVLCATVQFLWAQIRSERIRMRVATNKRDRTTLEDPVASPVSETDVFEERKRLSIN